MVFNILLLLIFISPLLIIIVFRVVEPLYMLLFNKPLYLYFYLFPEKLDQGQIHILRREFPFYNQLSDRRKVYFAHRVKRFMSHYQFSGKDGLRVTDEMKVLIAGTYTMLTFGMRNYLIDLFKVVVIFPSVYYSSKNETYHKGEFNPMMKAVVFSWEDFIQGHSVSNDNLNLGLHEFSHVLHFYSLKSNDPSAVIFYDEFQEVIKYFSDEKLNVELHEKGYFRLYAYENQFEFLAVILEHFFETPQIFKENHPELYTKVFAMINFKATDFK